MQKKVLKKKANYSLNQTPPVITYFLNGQTFCLLNKVIVGWTFAENRWKMSDVRPYCNFRRWYCILPCTIWFNLFNNLTHCTYLPKQWGKTL